MKVVTDHYFLNFWSYSVLGRTDSNVSIFCEFSIFITGDLLEESEVLQWLKDETEDDETVIAEEVVNETPKPKLGTHNSAANSPKKSSTSTADKTSESKPNKKPSPTKAKSEPAPTKNIKKEMEICVHQKSIY